MHATFYQTSQVERREQWAALGVAAFCAGVGIAAIIVVVAQIIMWVTS